MKTVLGASLLTLLILGGVVACEVAMWKECRTQHSWMYCVRTLSK